MAQGKAVFFLYKDRVLSSFGFKGIVVVFINLEFQHELSF